MVSFHTHPLTTVLLSPSSSVVTPHLISVFHLRQAAVALKIRAVSFPPGRRCASSPRQHQFSTRWVNFSQLTRCKWLWVPPETTGLGAQWLLSTFSACPNSNSLRSLGNCQLSSQVLVVSAPPKDAGRSPFSRIHPQWHSDSATLY